jgi:hypothetical protein
MHSLVVVPQGLLREVFCHLARLGEFRPSLAVASQRQADNPRLAATWFKLCGAVVCSAAGQKPALVDLITLVLMNNWNFGPHQSQTVHGFVCGVLRKLATNDFLNCFDILNSNLN